jgi:hypothetical protein
MESKFKLGKDALILAVMTLITVLTWVGFEVYLAAKKTTITKATQEQMKPLDPKINRKTIDSLKENLSFSLEELNFEASQPTTESGILE